MGNSIAVTYEETVGSLSESTETYLKATFLRLMDTIGLEGKQVFLHLCSRATIQKLNRLHRQVNRPTDILSWSGDDSESVPPELQSEIPWGELALCLEICKDQAMQHGWKLETELMRLLVHGLVHLTGADHRDQAEEEDMLDREISLLNLIGVTGIYEDRCGTASSDGGPLKAAKTNAPRRE